MHSDPDCPCAYIYVKDVVRSLVDLKRADASRLRRRMYNVHGFTATLSEVGAAVRRHLPGAQIAFEWDQSDAMRIANRSLSYEMDARRPRRTSATPSGYPLDAMIADFMADVRTGKAG